MQPVPADRLKDAFLDEVRKVKKFFYGTVIAQAQRIDVEDDRDRLHVRSAAPRRCKSQLEQSGRCSKPSRRSCRAARCRSSPRKARRRRRRRPAPAGQAAATPPDEKKAALREQALADSGVQAMLDVFAAEIKDVEEM